jgi:hypothetical protein
MSSADLCAYLWATYPHVPTLLAPQLQSVSIEPLIPRPHLVVQDSAILAAGSQQQGRREGPPWSSFRIKDQFWE